MVKPVFVAHSDPPPVIKNYYIEDYWISHSKYKDGDWMIVEYSQDTYSDELETQHIHTVGTRIVEGRPDLKPEHAGRMSALEHNFMPSGLRKTISSGDSEQWCISVRKGVSGDTSDVLSVRVDAGSSVALNPGQRAFLIHGTMALNGNEYQAPRLLKATAQRALTATTDVAYLFVWPKATVQPPPA
jgi:hypothetical protein